MLITVLGSSKLDFETKPNLCSVPKKDGGGGWRKGDVLPEEVPPSLSPSLPCPSPFSPWQLL